MQQFDQVKQTSPHSALVLNAVSSGYGESMVLRELSLLVPKGAIVALLGKNGMGKTTLLKSVMGFLPKRRGRIFIAGVDVTHVPAHRIARHSVSYTPQEQALFSDLSVRDNLRLGLAVNSLLEERFESIDGIFPFLKSRMSQRAGTLSGGEQKMLLIARALLSRPSLMLIDEITEGLQPSVIDRVGESLRLERQHNGTTMLLVEQNVDFALSVADQYAVLKRGEIVVEGETQSAGAEEAIRSQLRI
jgi:branched-chain amino acid transport system ATP-binding protein